MKDEHLSKVEEFHYGHVKIKQSYIASRLFSNHLLGQKL